MSKQEGALSRKKAWEKAQVRYPFWFGGSASCMAACVTHPLDLGKSFSNYSLSTITNREIVKVDLAWESREKLKLKYTTGPTPNA
jgi:hypothetical protein